MQPLHQTRAVPTHTHTLLHRVEPPDRLQLLQGWLPPLFNELIVPLGGVGSVIPVFMFTDDETGPPTRNALKHFVQLLTSRLNLRVSELIMSYTILEQVLITVRVHNSNPCN